MIETRSIEECQDLVELWLEGETGEVIAIMGGPPSDEFLFDYSAGGPYGRPAEKPAPKKATKTPARLKLVDEVGTTDKVKAS